MSKKALMASLLLAFLLTGCGAPAPSPSPSPTPAAASSADPQATPAPVPTPTPTPAPTPTQPPQDELFYNPLTGLEIGSEYANARPVAIMINNLKQALPQQGISQADIIYEVLAEGGITRMLALYQDPSAVPMIGSIRSARTYYLELALGHDAIYIHAGGSPDAYNKIQKWKVTSLDGISGAYGGSDDSHLMWRDSWRMKNLGFVHSVVTTGASISRCLPSFSIRLEHEEGYSYDMDFVHFNGSSPYGGESARSISVPFSNYKTGNFTYDANSGSYLVSQYGEAYMDMNNDQQVSATNVLILKTACTPIRGDSAGRITVDLDGSGTGFYACGGQYIPIRWEKDAPYGQLRYYTETGDQISLCAGKSYVNIVPNTADITFE